MGSELVAVLGCVALVVWLSLLVAMFVVAVGLIGILLCSSLSFGTTFPSLPLLFLTAIGFLDFQTDHGQNNTRHSPTTAQYVKHHWSHLLTHR